jgi:cytochrome c
MRTVPALLLAALLGGVCAAGRAATADPAQVAVKSGCMVCHAVDKKVVGPSYRDVARKYKGNAGAQTALVARLRTGGKGVWGEVAMPAAAPALIGDADLKAVIAWILKTP